MNFDFTCSRIVFIAEISIIYRIFKVLLVVLMVILIKINVVDAEVGGGGFFSFFIAIMIAYFISSAIWSMTFFLNLIPSPRRKVTECRGNVLFIHLENQYSINLGEINGIDFDVRHPLNFFLKNKITIRTDEKDFVIRTNFSYLPFYNHLEALKIYFAKSSASV